MKQYLICIAVVIQVNALAQVFVPYLGNNGKYAYAKEDGKPLFEPTFDSLPLINQGIIYIELERYKNKYITYRGQTIDINEKIISILPVMNLDSKGQELAIIDSIVFIETYSGSYLYNCNSLKKIKCVFWTPTFILNKINKFTGPRYFYFIEGLCINTIYGNSQIINTNLNIVYENKLLSSQIIDSNHIKITLLNREKIVIDSKGKALTDSKWEEIIPTNDAHQYIVSPFTNNDQLIRFGVVDDHKKLIIDTTYAQIYTFGNNYITLKNNKCIAFDKQGKTVFIENFVRIEKVGIQYFILKKDSSNYRALLLFDQKFNKMSKFVGNTNSIDILKEKPLRMVVSKIDNTQIKALLCDSLFTQLNALEYSDIQRISDNIEEIYLTYIDDKIGLINRDGKEICPAIYLQKFVENVFFTPHPNTIWLENQKHFFDAYKSNGKKDDLLSGRLSTVIDANARMYWDEGHTKKFILFKDGNFKEIPDSLKEYYLLNETKQVKADVYIFNKYNKKPLILNKELQPIVDKGYTLAPDLKTYTLLPVRKKRFPEKVKIEINDKGIMVERDKTKKDSHDEIKDDYLIDQLHTYSTVLDVTGKVLLPPKSDVIYFPISDYLVVEIPSSMKKFEFGKKYPSPLIIHKVNQENKGSIAVNKIFNDFFDTSTNNILISRKSKLKNDFMESAYIDEKGNLLAAFSSFMGPKTLSSKNLIQKFNPSNFSVFQNPEASIIDEKGKLIADLKKYIVTIENKSTYFSDASFNNTLDYLVVCDTSSLPLISQMEGMIGRSESFSNKEKMIQLANQMKFGIIDSLGNLTHPIKYSKITIVQPEKYFCSLDSNFADIIYDWQGNVIYKFKTNSDLINGDFTKITFHKFKNGNFLITNSFSTVLLGNNNNIIKEYERKPIVHDKDDNYFSIKKNGKILWVNSDGYEFKE